MSTILQHGSSQTKLRGVQSTHDDVLLNHFRGIPFGQIPQRFKAAVMQELPANGELDCTRFGPMCPQNYIDAAYLLRIPESLDDGFNAAQDEFNCLNLDIVMPNPRIVTGAGKLLPVVMWIHGGSQLVSFPPSSHKASDPSYIVAESVAHGKPIIFITFNYRLNIFGFGNGTELNLALKDQRLAIEWVRKYIGGFGGDKDNITLCGESAGAVYTHAQLCTSAPVKRGILQSGSLFLSPPQDPIRGANLIAAVRKNLFGRTKYSLEDAPVEEVLKQILIDNINPFWLQIEPSLRDWPAHLIDVSDVLIGDLEFESIIWRAGIETLTASEIAAAFTNSISNPDVAKSLLQVYHVSPTRDAASRIGALDFITDVRFGRPIRDITVAREKAGGSTSRTFRYAIDQSSPFQPSSRAHHGVDVLFLFGSYSESFSSAAARKVGQVLRENWITFANGDAPWNEENVMAFGPLGFCGEISSEEYKERRRVAAWEVLDQMSPGELATLFVSLANGRVSLLN